MVDRMSESSLVEHVEAMVSGHANIADRVTYQAIQHLFSCVKKSSELLFRAATQIENLQKRIDALEERV